MQIYKVVVHDAHGSTTLKILQSGTYWVVSCKMEPTGWYLAKWNLLGGILQSGTYRVVSCKVELYRVVSCKVEPTGWYLADSRWMPSVALVTVGTLDKDGSVAQTLRKHFSSDVIESKTFTYIPKSISHFNTEVIINNE